MAFSPLYIIFGDRTQIIEGNTQNVGMGLNTEILFFFFVLVGSTIPCHKLFCMFTGALFIIYPHEEVPVFLNNVECAGNETRLLDCDANDKSNDPYCDHIGVGCYDESESICSIVKDANHIICS